MPSRSGPGSLATQKGDLPLHSLPRSVRALWQVLGAAAIGALTATVAAIVSPVNAGYGALLGWDVAAVFYCLTVWAPSWRLDADGTAAAAEREDPSRAVSGAALLIAAIASLVAIVFTIADASRASGAQQTLLVLLGIGSVVCSWFVVHTLFTMSYARAYYLDEDGGIDFNMPHPPVWSDFAYLAFTIGMTFQVSDTDLQTSALRRIALRHMLLSYLFGAVIIAVTINLLAGLTH
jgi:uncharacterized membrane protein